jgi:hypothetical protein
MGGRMARILAVWFAFFMPAFPAFGGNAVDMATATCKDYENGSHQDMVDIVAAFHQVGSRDMARLQLKSVMSL